MLVDIAYYYWIRINFDFSCKRVSSSHMNRTREKLSVFMLSFDISDRSSIATDLLQCRTGGVLDVSKFIDSCTGCTVGSAYTNFVGYGTGDDLVQLDLFSLTIVGMMSKTG